MYRLCMIASLLSFTCSPILTAYLAIFFAAVLILAPSTSAQSDLFTVECWDEPADSVTGAMFDKVCPGYTYTCGPKGQLIGNQPPNALCDSLCGCALDSECYFNLVGTIVCTWKE